MVDTAAMVTLISRQFYNKIDSNIPKGETVKLKGLGNKVVSAQRIPQFPLMIGGSSYPTDVYVTDMTDSILLGLDFLSRHGCIVDLKHNTIEIYGERIPAHLKRNGSGDNIFIGRVTMGESKVFYPDTGYIIEATLQNPPSQPIELVIEPRRDKQQGLLVSASLISGNKAFLKIINPTASPIKLYKGHELGHATEAESCIIENDCDSLPRVRTVGPDSDSDPNLNDLEWLRANIPSHLADLCARSCKGRSIDEQTTIYK